MAKITKRTVDAAHPGPSRTFIWDSALPGFGIVVQPTGVKSYVYQYRTLEGQTRRIALGRHGELTPDQARDIAEKHAANVKAGGDPMDEKRGRRNALTVGDMLDQYLKSGLFAGKAVSTRGIDAGRIDRHLRPLLGNKIADKLTADEIRDAQKAIAAGKTAATVKTKPRGRARVKGGEGTARMAIRLLKAIYAWAYGDAKLVSANPAATVKAGTDGHRDAVVAQEQYPALFDAIQRLQTEGEVRGPAADAIRVIALTGARRGEIAGLRWRHVDLRAGAIVIPAAEHKTGRKTNKPREIGLPAAAQAIIARQAQGEPDDYVFEPARGEGAISLSKPWRAVRAAAGLRDDLGLHGLRHSLATHMAHAGAQAGQIMAVMGHRSLATSSRYVHGAQDVRARLAEQAAAGISAALASTPIASVVILTAKRQK